MEDEVVLNSAILAASKVAELNKDCVGKNLDHYPSLRKFDGNTEAWWDSLNYFEKIEIGQICLHYHAMTANSRFDCSDRKYKELGRTDKRRINFALSKKDDNYKNFDLAGMFGLNKIK